MSTGLTDLIHQLQDFSTQHPGDEARVLVAVPTAADALEHFEVGAVHQDGPALVLSCQPLRAEAVRPPDGTPQHRAEPTRACLHNDYEDCC
jgi:hypothetical protein